MERLTLFVSSRGILKSIVARNSNPESSNQHIDDNLLDKHEPGQPIYVCTDALSNFTQNFLSKIESPFTLVTGDSDVAITDLYLNSTNIVHLLENEKLITWFAQNLATSHPKLKPLPIGMDYHSMWKNTGRWGLVQQSAVAQEHALINVLAKSKDIEKRFFVGYVNWVHALKYGGRQECFDKINKDICFIEREWLPRISTWQRASECMFVVSPEGVGIDCHRTWESILLGCIPVIKKNSLSEMFTDLPVIILDSWDEFNRETIIKRLNGIQNNLYDFTPLFNTYWIDRIHGRPPFILEKMTISAFKQIICRESY